MKRVLVSANDPGGANAIVPVVANLVSSENEILVLVTGPAKDIFAAQGFTYIDAATLSATSLAHQVNSFQPDVFLAGTSEGYSIDKKIMDILQHSIPSVYVLDFWSTYSERFSKVDKDLMYVPEIICVMDQKAKTEMAQEGIEEKNIVVTGNPYFEHFADGITTDTEEAHQITFISQPISSLSNNVYGFDEYQALEGLCRAVEVLPREYYMTIRLHPRDEKDKYSTFLNDRVSISSEATLEDALSHAGLIIGMFSPVLMQAFLAGKKVIRYMPHSTTTFNDVFGDVVPLLTTEQDLIQRLTILAQDQAPSMQPPGWIVPGATNAVLQLIYSL